MADAKPNLIIQTAFLGDLLLAIPLIRNFRKIFPNEKLVLVCRKGFGSLFLKLKFVDEVIEVDKTSRQAWQDSISFLMHIKFSKIICPHMSWRSAWLVHSLKAEQKIGFDLWWNFFAFEYREKFIKNIPDALRQLSLITTYSEELKKQWQFQKNNFQNLANPMNTTVPDWAAMSWSASESDWLELQKSQDSFLKLIQENGLQTKQYAILAPGSEWPTKKWPHENYAQIVRRLQSRDLKVVLVGSAKEWGVAQQIEREAGGAINLCGRTDLVELLLLLHSARILLSNDSGVMHMASIAQTPTVSIFGPTTLDLGYRPWQNTAVVEQIDLPCRPCGKHGHVECPLGTHDCMKKLAVDQVFQSMKKLL